MAVSLLQRDNSIIFMNKLESSVSIMKSKNPPAPQLSKYLGKAISTLDQEKSSDSERQEPLMALIHLIGENQLTVKLLSFKIQRVRFPDFIFFQNTPAPQIQGILSPAPTTSSPLLPASQPSHRKTPLSQHSPIQPLPFQPLFGPPPPGHPPTPDHQPTMSVLFNQLMVR